MDSLLNPDRPPVFCPGRSHDRSVHTLDRALKEMGFKGSDVVIVSDIGCSGLFDTFLRPMHFTDFMVELLPTQLGSSWRNPISR